MHERKYAIWTIDVIHVKDGVGIAILVPLARNIHLVHALERLNNVRGSGEERLEQLRHQLARTRHRVKGVLGRLAQLVRPPVSGPVERRLLLQSPRADALHGRAKLGAVGCVEVSEGNLLALRHQTR